MKLAIIYEATREGTTGEYLLRAARSLGLGADHWQLSDAARVPADYDCYLRVDHGDDYEVRLPGRLQPAVFYAIDAHLPHSWRKIRRTASWYDAVFCCHLAGARRLRGAAWLPVACDPQIHGWRRSGEAAYDVAFVGTEGGLPRKFYLQALRERYPRSLIGPAPHTEMAGIYGRSRVAFNYSIAADVNMRMFEATAAGALLVTNALRGEELARLGFEDRRHLVLYRSPNELLDVIGYYLEHEAQREAIAAAGQAFVLARHTYADRMRQLLHELERIIGLVPYGYGTEAAAKITNDQIPMTK
ncbi:MAG: glycosyltransferase [Candidatus Omnitrophica bacterium]|nr:glycosyltransferase [Candidatus Omnitrophota bacterium]